MDSKHFTEIYSKFFPLSSCLTKGRLLLLYLFFFNLPPFLLLPQKFKDQSVEFFG